MQLLDEVMVKVAKKLLHAVMCVGTGLVYMQFIVLCLIFFMVGTTALAFALTASKTLL